jgi:hypothetical protein
MVMCKGGKVPSIIRWEGERTVLVVGMLRYIHGIMEGEAWKEEESKDFWWW